MYSVTMGHPQPSDKALAREPQRIEFEPRIKTNEVARRRVLDYKKPFTVCFEPYGCIHTDETWYDIKHRIVNLKPQDPSVIKTEFLLRTRETCFKEEILNPLDLQSLQSSSFNAARPTKFIVHGFTNSGRDAWIRRMIDALLTTGDFNVIAVDWRFGALPIYAQATANTRVVGLQIAYLINTLARVSGLKPEDVHIIGHSLGAQIAGYAGQNVTNLGRITGLDPAGPYFIGMPPYVQLDPNDALYVEALHTNAAYLKQLGYGTTQRVGNVDFLPNGGQYQPGCELLALKLIPFIKQYWNAGDIFACNHNRAVDLYIDAISNPITTFECESYEHFLKAACTSCRASPEATCAAMFGLEPGVDVQKLTSRQHVPMYFLTNSFSPYNLIHYRVTVKTDATKARADVTGHLNVTLIGSSNEIKNRPLHHGEAQLRHGTTISFLVTSSIELGDISELHLHWESTRCVSPLLGLCGNSLYVSQATVGKMTLEDPMARQAKTFHSCEETTSAVSGGGRGDEIPVQFGSYRKIRAGEKAVLLSTPCP